jgi:hypothetical protein
MIGVMRYKPFPEDVYLVDSPEIFNREYGIEKGSL